MADLPGFKQAYARVLEEFVRSPEERHLVRAAELGRELVLARVPPEEIAEIHEEAIRRLAAGAPCRTLLGSAARISQPLTEMLMAYGLAFREHSQQRRRLRGSLLQSERRYGLIFEAAPSLIATLDRHGMVLDCSVRSRELLGRARPELIGRPLAAHIHPGHVTRFEQTLAAVRRLDSSCRTECCMIAREGSPVEVAMDLAGLRDEQGECLEIICIITDITSRKRAEEVLARDREHLEALVEQRSRELERSRRQVERNERLASLGTLAAGIAHEVNNPLGLILLSIDAALESIGDVRTVERLLRQGRHEVKRCARIVQGVLGFAQGQPGERGSLDLNHVLRCSLDLARAYAEQCQVGLEARLAEGLPPVLGNATELEQVFVNLIHNAVEASGAGGHVVIETRETEGGVSAVVRDSGCGMDEEQLQHAFDPFYTTRLGEGGTGLGLSTAYGIVVDHGGGIELESEKGRGTRFTVRLPVLSGRER